MSKTESANNPFDPLLDLLADRLFNRFREGLNSNTGAEKWFYTSVEAEHLMGIPESWLVSAAKRGELKRVQFGHHKVFPREELLRFAEEYKKKSGL